MAGQPHPYVPTDLILPDFVPGFLPSSTILSVYISASFLVISLTWFISGYSAKAKKLDRVIMCWWAFTGLTHILLEGYFVFSPEFYKDKTPNYFSEVWKEYSKGDSRYAARDAGVVAVEGLTAVIEGPACLLAVYAIGKGAPYRYLLQFAISLGQLYGTFAYYITAYLDGNNFATSDYHYYAYFVFANVWWIIIPSLICIRCWNRISSAVDQQSRKSKKL